MRNIAELADTSLVNDKINKIEQMCVEVDAARKRNDTKELFNIVTKLNRDSSKTSPSSVNKRNGEPPTSFTELREEWTEYFKELLNANSTTNSNEASLSKKFPKLSKASKLVNHLAMTIM